MGVFRCNSCSTPAEREFVSWHLERPVKELATFLSKTILDDFEKATRDEDFKTHGEDLYSSLFTDPDRPESADGVRPPLSDGDSAFRRFLMNNRATLSRDTRSIFVRMFQQDADENFIMVPLDLLIVPGSDLYVGKYFRIETPLARQNYARASTCVNSCTVLAPTPGEVAGDDLAQVLDSFGIWLNQNKKHVVVDIDKFRVWLKSSTITSGPEVIMINSHHDNNRIFFHEPRAIESVGVARRFRPNSVVILNACGTAKNGATDFVRRFSLKGVSTVIATAYSVDSHMAGLFAIRLLEHLRLGSKDPKYTLSHAKFEAVADVAKLLDTNRNPYGPRALIFMLLGNSSVRVCPP